MSERPTPRVLIWLAEVQARWPERLLIVAVLSLIPAMWAANQLGFKPEFAELLPDRKPSVIEMRRVSSRLPGAATLSIVAQIEDGRQRQALRTFVDTLVPKLVALGPAWVGAVDSGVRDAQRFFSQNELLYADLRELREAHDQIVERYDWEVAKAAGTLIDEDDAPEPISAESLEKKLAARREKSKSAGVPSYPGGYYESDDGKTIAVLVRTPASGRAKTTALVQKVRAVIDELGPSRLDPTMVVHFTGDIITSQEEYDAIVRDLSAVGAEGVAGILLVVFLFFLRLRTLLVMAVTLAIGLLWTFGLTRYTIGYLNSSTGFLVSIIAGNGINYGIMYMARYIEARRDERLPVPAAIVAAHRDSWLPTLASAATAALAYGSLMVTDFRGFKHFGVIGAYGMLLCWLATYLFMPAVLAQSERILPAFRAGHANDDRPTRVRGYYGVLFAKLALGAPRVTVAIGSLLGLASVVLTVLYFSRDPMEYNMRKVRTEDAPAQRTSARKLSSVVDRIVGRLGQEGMAVMTDRVDQVPLLEAELDKRLNLAPRRKKPFEKVVSIFSLIPKDQNEKIPLIVEMRDRIERARARRLVSDADWAKIEPHLPKGAIRPIGIEDLPEQVARPFTERDGTRGRIVYIAPKAGQSVWDAHYLLRWADSFREVKLPTGEVIHGSGRAVISADMIRTIGEDAPKAIVFSALGTILVIVLAFRGSPLAFGVFVPWLLGVSGLVAFMYLKDVRLNFLNFVALPITIGIGAEYAHNMMQRYRIEGAARLRQVTTETGGAVTLCSLTTTIGYLALLMSINRGIQSFGLSAAVGELTCLFAAVLWLPALLSVLDRRRRAKAHSPTPALGER